MKQFDEGTLPSSELYHGDLLVLALPSKADLNLLADAFVTFIEEELEAFGDALVLTDDPFAWKEVVSEQFDEMCQAFLERAAHGPFLQAVWAEGRIGIVSGPAALDQGSWSRLVDKLIASQGNIADAGHEWHVLTNHVTPADRALPERPPLELQMADRTLPIPASRVQRASLALSRYREDRRHRVVAMRPIVLTMPDRAALEATFESLQERHEILQMTFSCVNGRDYICLTDSITVPFETVSALRPFRNLEVIATERTRVMAERPLTDRGLWRAELVQDTTHGIVICVFSDTIADTRTTELLRAEILEFYEGFRTERNPEAEVLPPALHYTDYAARESDVSATRAWWSELLSHEVTAAAQSDLPAVAPVETFEHVLSTQELEHLITVAQANGADLQSYTMALFVKVITAVEDKAPHWLWVSSQNQRPPGLEDMLGPFSPDCPIWIGDLAGRIIASALQTRITETCSHGFLSLEELTLAAPDAAPKRICHRFDWRNDALLVNPSASHADVDLTVSHSDTSLHFQWSVRIDYRGPATARSFAGRFLKHLDAALTVQNAGLQP